MLVEGDIDTYGPRGTNECSFMQNSWVPERFMGGDQLAESWELTDPQTVTVYLREGVYWQDKPPVNGREFTADDVVYNYDRLLGTGSGFTEPIPYYFGMLTAIDDVVATDMEQGSVVVGLRLIGPPSQ